ncbi:hypothetical protein [Ruegeria atlantica]|uniref:hypothetical protein n=1 Tax=Ruegeria atlantica TaxID=81569 RepID=UPI0020C31270|nr:hypothetical protein [Ruegeria atlantica]
MSASDAFLSAFFAIPMGSSTGHAHGRRYIVSRTEFSDGKSQKLVAHALDGGDYISLNLYLTNNGYLLRPCEMPAEKVTEFVLGFAVKN